ncbi:hypothetical protein CL629_00445 [bacterium]|nr:hypothetical protein [bacterium]|tara:strand:- start:9275 stop:10837 length:1563 start_codon:yes stop_codon:yes gene_type:complete
MQLEISEEEAGDATLQLIQNHLMSIDGPGEFSITRPRERKLAIHRRRASRQEITVQTEDLEPSPRLALPTSRKEQPPAETAGRSELMARDEASAVQTAEAQRRAHVLLWNNANQVNAGDVTRQMEIRPASFLEAMPGSNGLGIETALINTGAIREEEPVWIITEPPESGGTTTQASHGHHETGRPTRRRREASETQGSTQGAGTTTARGPRSESAAADEVETDDSSSLTLEDAHRVLLDLADSNGQISREAAIRTISTWLQDALGDTAEDNNAEEAYLSSLAGDGRIEDHGDTITVISPDDDAPEHDADHAGGNDQDPAPTSEPAIICPRHKTEYGTLADFHGHVQESHLRGSGFTLAEIHDLLLQKDTIVQVGLKDGWLRLQSIPWEAIEALTKYTEPTAKRRGGDLEARGVVRQVRVDPTGPQIWIIGPFDQETAPPADAPSDEPTTEQQTSDDPALELLRSIESRWQDAEAESPEERVGRLRIAIACSQRLTSLLEEAEEAAIKAALHPSQGEQATD